MFDNITQFKRALDLVLSSHQFARESDALLQVFSLLAFKSISTAG